MLIVLRSSFCSCLVEYMWMMGSVFMCRSNSDCFDCTEWKGEAWRRVIGKRIRCKYRITQFLYSNCMWFVDLLLAVEYCSFSFLCCEPVNWSSVWYLRYFNLFCVTGLMSIFMIICWKGNWLLLQIHLWPKGRLLQIQ